MVLTQESSSGIMFPTPTTTKYVLGYCASRIHSCSSGISDTLRESGTTLLLTEPTRLLMEMWTLPNTFPRMCFFLLFCLCSHIPQPPHSFLVGYRSPCPQPPMEVPQGRTWYLRHHQQVMYCLRPSVLLILSFRSNNLAIDGNVAGAGAPAQHAPSHPSPFLWTPVEHAANHQWLVRHV